MRGIFTFFLSSLMIVLYAQYPIGHRQIVFNDASRSRDIQCEIYYPGTANGNDVSVANGDFPFIVFGHGFNMGYDAYLNFTDVLVPLGYVIVLPTTEGGLSPDHGAFGLDLRFLNDELKTLSTSSTSFFLYNHFNGRTSIMGHSMGGGASFLAASSNPNITALVNFAAAETDPSAIAAAGSVIVPTLVFCGENDGVAPPTDHQNPMYYALNASTCKYKIVINGGGHCYFADANTICSLGELFTTPQPTIDRETQHDIQFNLLIPFLNWQLMDQIGYKQIFMDSLSSSTRVTYEYSCPMSTIEEHENEIQYCPNPAHQTITISGPNIQLVQIFDIYGRLMITTQVNGSSFDIDVAKLEIGTYLLYVIQSNQQKSYLLQKN